MAERNWGPRNGKDLTQPPVCFNLCSGRFLHLPLLPGHGSHKYEKAPPQNWGGACDALSFYQASAWYA